MSTQFIKFKQPKQGTTLMFMHPLIMIVMFDMSLWCYQRGINFVVTDTISTLKRDRKIGRVFSGHRDRRAFDLRSRTFTPLQKSQFIELFNDKYDDIASISASDNVSRLIVEHGNGDNLHFHICLHSKFKVLY